MSREVIRAILYRVLHNDNNENILSLHEVEALITAYCKEKGKQDDNIRQLLQILRMNQSVLSGCFLDVLDYYKIKFQIGELYSKEHKLLAII